MELRCARCTLAQEIEIARRKTKQAEYKPLPVVFSAYTISGGEALCLDHYGEQQKDVIALNLTDLGSSNLGETLND